MIFIAKVIEVKLVVTGICESFRAGDYAGSN